MLPKRSLLHTLSQRVRLSKDESDTSYCSGREEEGGRGRERESKGGRERESKGGRERESKGGRGSRREGERLF